MSIIRTMLKEMDVKYTCSSCKMKNEDGKYFITTVGQLNFFQWAIENYIINFIE